MSGPAISVPISSTGMSGSPISVSPMSSPMSVSPISGVPISPMSSPGSTHSAFEQTKPSAQSTSASQELRHAAPSALTPHTYGAQLVSVVVSSVHAPDPSQMPALTEVPSAEQNDSEQVEPNGRSSKTQPCAGSHDGAVHSLSSSSHTTAS